MFFKVHLHSPFFFSYMYTLRRINVKWLIVSYRTNSRLFCSLSRLRVFKPCKWKLWIQQEMLLFTYTAGKEMRRKCLLAKLKTKNIVRHFRIMYIASFAGQKEIPYVNSASLWILAAILSRNIWLPCSKELEQWMSSYASNYVTVCTANCILNILW